jgi:hypothetical protein
VVAHDKAGGLFFDWPQRRKRRLAIIACSWPPLVKLAGHRPKDQISFFLRSEAF